MKIKGINYRPELTARAVDLVPALNNIQKDIQNSALENACEFYTVFSNYIFDPTALNEEMKEENKKKPRKKGQGLFSKIVKTLTGQPEKKAVQKPKPKNSKRTSSKRRKPNKDFKGQETRRKPQKKGVPINKDKTKRPYSPLLYANTVKNINHIQIKCEFLNIL